MQLFLILVFVVAARGVTSLWAAWAHEVYVFEPMVFHRMVLPRPYSEHVLAGSTLVALLSRKLWRFGRRNVDLCDGNPSTLAGRRPPLTTFV